MCIRDSSWRDSLLPKLREFLLNVPSEDGRIRLAIEAHATLAFAAGAVLDAKSGRLTELEQRSPVMKIWAPDDDTLSSASNGWVFSEHELDPDGSGTVCAVSLTRETEGSVRQFLEENPGHFRRLLVATLVGGASPRALTSGAHANHLAEQLASKIAVDRVIDKMCIRDS